VGELNQDGDGRRWVAALVDREPWLRGDVPGAGAIGVGCAPQRLQRCRPPVPG